jgi:ADP-ribose pyrophosphatase
MAADAGFEILGGEVLAETPFLRVEELNLQGPDGTVTPRSVVRIGGAVAVVAVDGDEVVLIKQYRTALDRAIVELPAGKLDIPDEEPQAAAARELIEEVGYTADRWEQIAFYNTSPGYSDEFVIIYLARDLTPVAMKRVGPEEEAAEIVRIPVGKIREVLPSIEDSKTVIGLQALLLSGEVS